LTPRERFLKTLHCEPIGGQTPTFELEFQLTMEAFGRLHPGQRNYRRWDQMSRAEQRLHLADLAQLYVDIARRYDHSAILVLHPGAGGVSAFQELLEDIREKSGDAFCLLAHGDPTWAIPDGDTMMDFSIRMYEEPEALNEQSQRRLERALSDAAFYSSHGHLLDGFALCSDYCFNVNPFFSPEQFDQFITPYLRAVIDGYREMGYCTIKHTDGNIMPIVRQMASCRPDAIHSLDPQGGVTIPAVREAIGDQIALIGNVNCALLQTGSEEACRADILRSLREGMARGYGYVFSTSNCAYTGLPLARYELLNALWRQYGCY
jgi:uroporphyrinogen decarboxylase